jgi:3-hydroxyacyl-[acyl-carrier-protein] dehydratase
LLRHEDVIKGNIQVALTSHQIDFYLPVFPNERVTVVSEKEYFRFNKLKCKVKMFNRNDELVCRGIISGMLKVLEDE